MTKEDIIRMAREADREWDCDRDMVEWLEWFAALIASRVAAASASVEREACAKVAETPVGEYEVIVACGTDPVPHRIPRYLEWNSIAAAIRARGAGMTRDDIKEFLK